jgi:hypothetical protein
MSDDIITIDKAKELWANRRPAQEIEDIKQDMQKAHRENMKRAQREQIRTVGLIHYDMLIDVLGLN